MNPGDLGELSRRVQARSGLLLRGDKSYFVESRLTALARRENASNAEALVQRLLTEPDGRLLDGVCEALAVTDTAFLRDAEVFEHLRRDLLPDLATRRSGRPLQVWCAGCATGQEAYSLAMLALEMAAEVPGLRLEIVATDLVRKALEKAYAGLFTQFEVQRGLPIRYLLRHFEKAGDMWSASDALRSQIRWRRLNLMEARRSVRQFDLILCRYVAAYLDHAVRGAVLDRLVPALAEDGVLALGLDDAPPAGFLEETPGLGVFLRATAIERVA